MRSSLPSKTEIKEATTGRSSTPTASPSIPAPPSPTPAQPQQKAQKQPSPEPEPKKDLNGENKKREESNKEKDLGNSFYKKKQFSEAIEHYNKAFEIDNTNVTVLTNKAGII